ncbi:MAG TPA: SDR family oxidoreductase [Candidatus Eisenbacteria bacterium]|nr:SDR family oxidoreductase [Candidatus Eisenbacteria bacterium]
MARFLVTGGAGFIGSHIAERLLRDGHEVRVLDNLATGRKANLDLLAKLGGARFEWIEGDLRDPAACLRACDGAEAVFHQAALASVQRSIENPTDTTAVNVTGTVNVLSAARSRGVRRVVCASSSSVYGNTPTLPKHEAMTPAPLSPYAASKLAGEQFSEVFTRTLGVEAVSLRYFNVFGPRQDPTSQYAAVIPLFVTALFEGRRPVVFGDGTQSRDFTFVDNVVDANLRAASAPGAAGEAINIACGDRFSLLDLLASLGKIIGVEANPDFQPPRVGDVLHSQASIDKATRILGFAPKVGFEEGLRRTVESVRAAR